MNRSTLAGLSFLALLVGCNTGSLSGTVPASGKVTYKGNPVEGAIVTFLPEGEGRPATATTVTGGTFSLTTVDSAGAMPGKYKVTIDKVDFATGGASSMEEASVGNAKEGQMKKLLPKKYADAGSTPLSAEVPSAGKKEFDFALVD